MFSTSPHRLTFRYAGNLPYHRQNIIPHHVIHSMNRRIYVTNQLKNDRKKIDRCWRAPPAISIVGSSRIRNTDYWLGSRIIWFCVLVACFGCFLWQLWDCTKSYYDQPVSKTVEVTRNEKIQFPALYLCPGLMRDFLSSFFKDNMKKCGLSDNCFSDPLNRIIFDSYLNSTSHIETVNEIWTFDDRERVQIYRPCLGADGECSGGIVSWDVRNTTIKSFWGACFLLNTAKDTDYRGPFTYFTLMYERAYFDELFAMLNKQLANAVNPEEIKHLRRSRNRDRVGLLIYFHHEFNTKLSHVMFFKAHEILQGFLTHVEIRKKVFERIDRRMEKCTQSEDEFIECTNACLENRFSKTCRMPYVSTTPDSECRTNHKDYDYKDVHLENYEVYSNFSIKYCDCTPVCKEIIYTPMIDVVEKLKNNSIITIKFYFGINSFETTTEKLAYPFTDYLSDVGGTLGCFLGGCVLNILEIIEYLVYCIKKHH